MIKKIFLISICVISLNSYSFAKFGEKEVAQLSKNIEIKLTATYLKKIAVLEFVNVKGDLPNLGNYVRSSLFDQLSESKDINVMLNREVNELLKEQKMSAGSLVDDQFILDILGVDAVVSGIVTDFPDKIKINAKITAKKEKLLAVYSAEIMKNEKEKPLLERIIQGEATKQSTNKANSIFLNENFSTYKPNTVPEDKGYSFLIVEAQGKNCISSKSSGERDLKWDIDFPENFTLSFNFIPLSADARLDCSLVFVDEDKKEFITKFRSAGGQSDYVLFPGSTKASAYFSATKLNNLKLEKKKDIYKIFLNDKEIAFGVYTTFKQYHKVILRADFSQGRFTDFYGVDSGK